MEETFPTRKETFLIQIIWDIQAINKARDTHHDVALPRSEGRNVNLHHKKISFWRTYGC